MATPEGQSVDAKTDDEENALDGQPLKKNDIDDEEKHKKKDESKTSAGFHYGWDEENRTAWRSPFEAPTAKQFPTATPTVYNDQLEVSFLEKDGAMTKHIIREVSVADYKEMTKVDWETTRGPLEILPMEWDKNGKTTVQLEIHKKMTSTDGDVLLLFRCEELHLPRGKQKRKQKLQVCLKWFNEEDITVSRKMGLEIMKEVAAKYLEDNGDDRLLEQHRDDAIAERGKQVPEKPGFPKQKNRGPTPSKEMMRLRSPSRRPTRRSPSFEPNHKKQKGHKKKKQRCPPPQANVGRR